MVSFPSFEPFYRVVLQIIQNNTRDKNERDTVKNFDYIKNGVKQCRVCLKDGVIPIYGDNTYPDVSEQIRLYADVELTENDNYPKFLCESCYELLQNAILFRKTAAESLEILKKNHTKCDYSGDYPLYSSIVDSPINADEPSSPSNGQEYYTPVLESCNEQNKTEKSSIPKKSTQPKAQCEICMKVMLKSSLKSHYVLHDPTSSFVCDVCGKVFRYKVALRNHYVSHRTEFNFKCEFCPYKGKCRSLLKTHMRTHTRNFKYKCTQCPAKFLWNSNLHKHLRTHKEKEYKCDMCTKAFRTNSYLKEHIEAYHLGLKNQICNLCGKGFGYRKNMIQHQRVEHKRENKFIGRTPLYIEAELKQQDTYPVQNAF